MNLQTETFFDLTHFPHRTLFEGGQYPWQPLLHLKQYMDALFSDPHAAAQYGMQHILAKHGNAIWIGQNVVIEPGAVIKGPAIIGNNCEIRNGAYIREYVILGEGCIVGNSTELKHSVLLNNVEVPHFNYVGDSVLGNRAHLSGGAIISNQKLDASTVVIRAEGQEGIQDIDTGLSKLGAIVGDSVQIGANSVLNPGAIIGKGSVIYPLANVRGVIAANQILKVRQQQEFVEKME